MAGKALLAVQYERQYAEAIDKDYKFTTAERTAYLTNARRYAGQIVLDTDEDKMYRLNFAGNAWLPLGSSSLPDQDGNAGKFLTTDGTNASWSTVDSLPSQSGNSGKYLTTDGTTSSWGASITTDVAPAQQALLSTTANWSTPTASSVSYYTGATALSGNKQGQFYFDGLFFYFFIADDYPIRLAGTLHGILIQSGTVLTTALETILQNKIALANEPSVTFKVNPDFGTSDDVEIKGVMYDVTEDRMADDGSVPASGTYTYSYRDSATATWTTGQTLAQLKTRLTSHLTDTITIVKATNTTTTVLNRVRLNLKRYA